MLATEAILLGARTLAERFTEWDIAVAAWKACPSRFGLRGYEAQYPDNKRVYVELCKRYGSAAMRGLIARVDKNTYSLTPIGRAVAEWATDKAECEELYTVLKPKVEHDACKTYIQSGVFVWPESWDQQQIEETCLSALSWLGEHGCDYLAPLRRPAISVTKVTDLLSFIRHRAKASARTGATRR